MAPNSDPTLPPKWAQEAVADILVRRLVDGNLPDDGPGGLYAFARLLVSVRESTLREAADVAMTAICQEDPVGPAILALAEDPGPKP